MSRPILAVAALLGASLGLLAMTSAAQPPDPAGPRERAAALLKKGDYADALKLYEQLLKSGEAKGQVAADDLRAALRATDQLGRQELQDGLRETALAARPNDPFLIRAAAESLLNGFHYGYVIDGEFTRGQQRRGGNWTQVFDWDRVRALQLLVGGLPHATAEAMGGDGAAGSYRVTLADAVMNGREGNSAWLLQTLTDLETLPDRADPDPIRQAADPSGAPVTADGDPVFYGVPAAWEAASSDGERWRWALAEAAKFGPDWAAAADLNRAQFLETQFGVGTLSGQLDGLLGEDGTEDAGPWALSTLKDTETIARLATGPKRFPLPEEHNHLALYQQVGGGETDSAVTALNGLAGVYQNRRQYPAAVKVWDRVIEHPKAAPAEKRSAEIAREQIVGAYAAFEPEPVGPAGTEASVALTYKNAEKATLRAYRVNERKWFEQTMRELTKAAGTDFQNEMSGDLLNLWWAGKEAYTEGPIGEWTIELDPPADHTPARKTIETPLKEAGLYFVAAELPNGRTYGVSVQRADLAIAVKPLVGSRALWIVTDAATGAPVEGVKLDLLGYGYEWIRPPGRRALKTIRRTAVTGPDGAATVPEGNDSQQIYQWFATASKPAGGDEPARFGAFGFSDRTFGAEQIGGPLGDVQMKAYAVSDRPAYRPGDTVNLKGWYRRAGYALPTDAQEPQRRLKVVINDPRGEELLSQEVEADEFGAFQVSLELGGEATLGQYHASVGEARNFPSTQQHALNFRVEEYRKPEFEVTVDAPAEPIVLGEEFTATVRAEYLFGGPVAGGVLSYKVTRTVEDAGWHPYDPWEWLYGPAYWSWAPGYQQPDPYGYGRMGGPWRGNDPEEVVAEGDAALGEDGTFKIPLDSSLAKALNADADHRYTITAEVTDASRRTETGGGSVLAAAVPFRVYGYADYGYAVAGEPIGVNFTARTAGGEPLRQVGELAAFRLTGGPDGKTVATPLEQTPEPAIDADGVVSARFLFPTPGQYRVDYQVTADGHTGKESVVLNVVGANGEAGAATVADGLELIPNRKTYAPGDTAKLLLKTEAEVVYLFPRAENGTVPEPVLLRPKGGAVVYDLPIGDADAPNIWVEALAVSGGRLHSVSLRIVVPPTERLLTVEAKPSADRYEPGEEAEVTVTVTDATGEPVQGDVALTVYDRAIDALVGGPNAPDIRKHFTDLLRYHNVQVAHNLSGVAYGQVKQDDDRMPTVGLFGGLVLSDDSEMEMLALEGTMYFGTVGGGMGGFGGGAMAEPQMAKTFSRSGGAPAAPMAAAALELDAGVGDRAEKLEALADGGAAAPAPQVRENFADTALWTANLDLKNGVGTARFALPDDLTGWQIRTWAVGPGSAVGSADGRFVTKKSLLVRLQTPRFLTETDEIVLSALVRSELEQAVEAEVRFDFGEGSPLANPNLGDLTQTVAVPAGKEVRVDLRVAATGTGEANVTAVATTTLPDGTPGPGDAVKQTFPVLEHGTLRTESFAGTVEPGQTDSTVNFTVTEQRDPQRSALAVRFSPSLAVAAVDALPYLAHYPYGCAEQTLNRFLPVLTMRHRLEEAGVTLPTPEEVTANLNASRRGRPFAEWEEKPNPVFDREQVFEMTQEGVDRLATFARPDGGFGWFPGARSSDVYMTTLVTHGLWLASQRGADVPQDLIAGGQRILAQHQAREVAELKRGELPEKQREGANYKLVADSLDAQIFRVLSDLGADPDDATHAAMAGYLFRDRLKLPIKAQALLGLAFAALQDGRLETSLSNLRQYLVNDEENQTAYLRLPNDGGWWYWWNNDLEANALYLELLSTVGQTDGAAPKLVKYLLNNRQSGSRWASTRDTAHVIEAFAAYLKATGEAAPTADVMITLDGKRLHTVSITPENLFTFDGTAILEGEAVTAGEHVLSVQRATPEGAKPAPLYFTARVTTFDKRPFIPAAGLEIKVTRSVRRITDVDETRAFANDDGNVDEREVDQNAREDLAAAPGAPAEATSGDLIEVELILEAKNDYTYVILSDAKAAGFEPVGSQPGTGPLSGWVWDGLHAYREFRDERTDFFLPNLPRGRHSLRYRLRAEAPGTLHALPAVAEGMYAPELRGNSDEWTAIVADREDLTP
ncbi:alpha-2-macroglobulin family protein [Alienimonas californiensis]|uniref:MG2 domain protein n=1 Tax=Alienimonas californiensis TaxID=2527989 RepID=A0A517PA72_9PLAN|nr:MG2 domain-containing protein [Alienimonas californiensis]QDT16265.1 MG2 domain protein [Alienimonas californiensis]